METPAKIYAAVLVTLPSDDYAYGNIAALSQDAEKSCNLVLNRISTDDACTDSNYLILVEVSTDAFLTSEEQKKCSRAYDFDENAGTWTITSLEDPAPELKEAIGAALDLFSWS